MKRFVVLFLFMLVSLMTLVLAVSCSNNSPNSAFVAPAQTISANNPTWSPTPTPTYTASPTPTPAFPVSGFNGPYALAIDSNGLEYVGDTGNNIIRQYNAGVQNTWPYGKIKTSGLSYSNPKAIAVDPSNNFYVVGNGNGVSKYQANGDFVAQYNTTAGLSGPLGVACSSTTLFVSDTGNKQIVGFALAGGAPTTVLSSLSYTPNGLATNSSGTPLYVAGSDNNVHIYTYSGSWGNGTPATIPGFSSPYAVALDASGNVYVSDTGNKQVEEFTVGNFANSPVNIFGLGTLNAPEGIALDASGNIYVVDSGNSVFYEFAP